MAGKPNRKDGKPHIKTLKNKAWELFSEYIRKRGMTAHGMNQCVSCGSWHYWKMMDAGHYCSRRNNNVLFDERNVWPQCRKCNRFNEGNKAGYTIHLQKVYGEGIIDELNQAQFVVKRFTVEELQELIRDLKLKLKSMPKV